MKEMTGRLLILSPTEDDAAGGVTDRVDLPEASQRVGPPTGVKRMVRVYLLQQWLHPSVEDELQAQFYSM